MQRSVEADIGLCLEGTYPFVKGGVSSWIHELIRSLPELSFSIMVFTDSDKASQPLYPVPSNVVSIHRANLFQEVHKPKILPSRFPLKKELIEFVDSKFDMNSFHQLILKLGEQKDRGKLCQMIFFQEDCYEVLENLYYNSPMYSQSFLTFYWQMRSLLTGYINCLSFPSIHCRVYHCHSTGYGGLLGYIQKCFHPGSKLMVTEHGIYTRERSMDLSFSSWPEVDMKAYHPSDGGGFLKKIWIESFHFMSRNIYNRADRILSLFEGNNLVQIQEGAPRDKVSYIRNGIDCTRFEMLERKPDPNSPVIGFIGRIVKIKNIKEMIAIAKKVVDKIPGARFVLAGPNDEDPRYFQECLAYTKALNLSNSIEFPGSVNALEFYRKIDLLILCSLSEGQPLVLIEAGATGLPQVCVDVGGCKEMIEGGGDDTLPPSGKVIPQAETELFAQAILELLQNQDLYQKCSRVARQRVKQFYNVNQCNDEYGSIYKELLGDTLQ